MKKLVLFLVAMVISSTFLSAQTTTPQTAESLLKKLEKSDKDIQHPKKSLKYTTWQKRGDLLLDMVQFTTKGLWKGMPQKGVLNSAEMLIGKPKQIITLENKEDWEYDRLTLKFIDGKLDKWIETKPLVDGGLDKASEAYAKAWELDKKGKLKSDKIFMERVSILRGLFSSEGVIYYNEAEKTKKTDTYKKAVVELEKSLKMDEYPKTKTDTVFNRGLVTYYIGVIAQSGKLYDIAEKYYNICLEKEYEGAKAYHGLASLYGLIEQEEKELETLQNGFKKYPNSNELLVDFINYYLSKGESEKALVKLKKGIKENPENQTYHYAIGTLYDTMMKDTTDKYSKEQKAEYEKLAISSYKHAIELKPDYFNALYNVGALYYNKAALIIKAAQDIPPRETKRYDTEMEKAKESFKDAIPFMEKAHEIDISDKNTLLSLSTIYLKLQMYDKQKEIKEMLDNLPEE